MNPFIRVCKDHESLSRRAADRIHLALGDKPGLLLCAAGGATPLRTYELLAERQARDPASFRALRVVKLDEWGGLPDNDPGSCEHQLQVNLIKPLSLPSERYFGFRSSAADPGAERERMRNLLSSEGPIDLCILGLGANGHVAMNEPAAALQPFAHVATLAESSLRHPMLARPGPRPAFGLTLGLAEILASREILLLVSGSNKREPLGNLFRREVTPRFPASFLWLHPRWALLCDRAAADGVDLEP